MLLSSEIEPKKIKQSIGYCPLLNDKYYVHMGNTFPEIAVIFYNAFNKTYLLDDEEMIKTAKAVCAKIRLGVIKNNEIRDFNLLDYSFITDIPLSLLAPTIKNMNILSLEDRKKLTILLSQYTCCIKSNNEDECFKTIMNGNLYDGKGSLLADQETKENIVEFLRNNNITLKYYNLALYAYINGEIDLNTVYSKEIPNNIRTKIKTANLVAIKRIAQARQMSDYHKKVEQQKIESENKYQEALSSKS